MVGDEDELSIGTHYGVFRDLVPIFSWYQFFLNVVVLSTALWLVLWLGRIPALVAIILMLGWVFQFVSRPSEMFITKEQTAWLEAVLEKQGFFGKSECDGRWQTLGTSWWQRWPHFFIEFIPDEVVKVIAPRDVMESIRSSLELLQEHGELTYSAGAQSFAFAPPPEEEPDSPLPWQTKVPSAVIGTTCVIAFLWVSIARGGGAVTRCGLSASALSEGKFETIFLHMFAHAGAMHLVMNMTALAGIGPALTSRLGRPPLNWLRFVLLFFLSGLAGAALFLALHPTGSVPMVGASGALYGLIGLLIRTQTDGGTVISIKNKRVRRIGWDLVKQNAFLFVLLAMLAWTSGTAGGLAWEAHLGGFLFGLCVGPKLLPRAPAITTEGELVSDDLAATK
jgi:membrane associated rhomboid family serine protease